MTNDEKIAALEAENKKLREQLDSIRDTEYARFLAMRNIDVFEGDEPCSKCDGSGVFLYGTTATYRGGAGGTTITSDVCNKCWGSGNEKRPWVNLLKVRIVNGN